MQTKHALRTMLALLISTNALGQAMTDSSMKGMDMSKPGAMKMDMKPDAKKMDHKAEPVALTEGEVRKLDKEQGSVTLKHGEIKNLGMPGMTMVFHTTDKTMLDKVKEGDKVKFAADMVDGRLAVTGIEPVQP